MIEVIGGCLGLVLCGFYLGRMEERRQSREKMMKVYAQGYHDGKWCRNKADIEWEAEDGKA